MKKSIVILLHTGYWLVYWVLVSFIVLVAFHDKKNLPFSFFFLSPIPVASILPGVIGFYTSYRFLFNKYLADKKIVPLITAAVAVSLVASVVTLLFMYVALGSYKINWTAETSITMGLFLVLVSLMHSATGLVMQGFVKWFGDIKLKEELNRKNYEMELALVKSQINPHFLFNTINNIDMLIAKDASSASAYLNKLSDIMRFMLYETKTEKIPLTKELMYIEKFIELQKIRTTNSNFVNYTVKGDSTNVMIPPMLFIAFVENAFKHSGNKKVDNAINISVDIDKDSIRFRCENSFNPNAQQKQDGSGLGSELIKKRLALLYPDKHTLAITNNNELYKVDLTLQIP